MGQAGWGWPHGPVSISLGCRGARSRGCLPLPRVTASFGAGEGEGVTAKTPPQSARVWCLSPLWGAERGAGIGGQRARGRSGVSRPGRGAAAGGSRPCPRGRAGPARGRAGRPETVRFSTCLVGLSGVGLAGGDPRGPRLAFRLGRFSEAQSLPSRARPDAGLLDAARDGNALQLISCNYPRRPGPGFCLRLELLPLPTPPRSLSPDQPRSPRPPPEMSRWGQQIQRRPLLV